MGPCPTQTEIWFLDWELDDSLFSSSCLCQSSRDLYWESAVLPLKLLDPRADRSFTFYVLPLTDIQRQNSRCFVIGDLSCCPHLSCGPPVVLLGKRPVCCLLLLTPHPPCTILCKLISSLLPVLYKSTFCSRINSSWFSSRLFFTLICPLWTLYPPQRSALRGVGSR